MPKQRYGIFDGNVIPVELIPYLTTLKKETGAHFNSIYRGADAEPLLHKLGKHSQTELYVLHERDPAHYAPANPPGYSTHEMRSDGAAYPSMHRGAHLAWWQCGFDVNDSDVKKVEAAAARHGWEVFQPYKAGSEFHHLNFRKKPTIVATYAQWAKWYVNGRKGKRPNVPQRIPGAWWTRLKHQPAHS